MMVHPIRRQQSLTSASEDRLDSVLRHELGIDEVAGSVPLLDFWVERLQEEDAPRRIHLG